jgi:chromate reductase
MAKLKVLGISGSLRNASFNRRLLEAAAGIASEAGSDVTVLPPKALSIPVYDADIEASGLPPAVAELAAQAAEAEVFLIASPEYNYSVPAPLKNWIDWLSRVKPNPFPGKYAAIMGVSGGPMGTIRMQPHLRQILESQNLLLVSQPQLYVPNGETAFLPDGSLADPSLQKFLKMLVEKTLETAGKLKA